VIAVPSPGKLLRDAPGSRLAPGPGSDWTSLQLETRQPAQPGSPISEIIYDSLHFSFAYSWTHATFYNLADLCSLLFRLPLPSARKAPIPYREGAHPFQPGTGRPCTVSRQILLLVYQSDSTYDACLSHMQNRWVGRFERERYKMLRRYLPLGIVS
jgi:hypothetical protein